MADLTPSFKDILAGQSGVGQTQGDQDRINYNLWKAIVAIANNIDEDNSNIGTDYMSKIGTPLNAAMAKQKTPPGPTTTGS